MKLHYVTIAIIAVSMIILGSVQFINDLGDGYDTTADLSGLNNTESRLEEQEQNAQELSDELTGFALESPSDFFAIPYKMISVSWQLLKTIFSSWATVGTMMKETGKALSEAGVPLPGWFVPSLIAIIVVLLGSIIAYMLFKWKAED